MHNTAAAYHKKTAHLNKTSLWIKAVIWIAGQEITKKVAQDYQASTSAERGLQQVDKKKSSSFMAKEILYILC